MRWLKDFWRGLVIGFVQASVRRAQKQLPAAAEVSTGNFATPRAELEANRAEAEADLMHASRHLQTLLVARADPELTEAIGRWSLALSRVVDLSAAVNNAKEVTVR